VDETNKAELEPSEAAPHKGSGGPPATSKARELLARHYSDRFWSSLSSTSTALMAWLAALLLIWGGYILPLPQKLERLANANKQVQNDGNRLQAWEQKLQKPVPTRDALSRLKLAVQQAQKNNYQGNLRETQGEGEELQEDLDKIDTPLGTLEINKKFVPALWAILFAGLFTFYVQRRVLLLAMIGRAIRIHTSELGDQIKDLGGLGAWAPFWLAPLPDATRDSQVSREDIRAILGWGPRDGWRSFASSLVLAALLGLYASVLFVSWTIIDLVGKGEGQFRVLTIVVLGLLYCLALGGLSLWRPICYDGFPDRMLAEFPGRRAFLAVAGTASLVGLAILASPRYVISGLLPGKSLRVPRYRKPIRKILQPLAATLQNSFRLNLRSKIVHYVDWEGWSAGAEGMAERNLSPVERAQVKSLLPKPEQVAPNHLERLNLQQAGAMAERLALEAAQQNNLDLALNLLWQGIGRDKAFKSLNLNRPSYRLYDLYVGLTVRAGELGSERWKQFLHSVREQRPMDAAIQQRLAHWESFSQDSRRAKRWTGEKLLWRLPEKRPSGNPSSNISKNGPVF
jgi:hypothetical protein